MIHESFASISNARKMSIKNLVIFGLMKEQTRTHTREREKKISKTHKHKQSQTPYEMPLRHRLEAKGQIAMHRVFGDLN